MATLLIEERKTKIRAGIYRLVRKVGIEYPPGVEDAIHQRAMGKINPTAAAVAVVKKFWPDEFDAFQRMPPCDECNGTGQSTEASYATCRSCGGFGRRAP